MTVRIVNRALVSHTATPSSSLVSKTQLIAASRKALTAARPLQTTQTEYPFEKIKPLFGRRLCEVLINFMYSFVSRFVETGDKDIISSLDPILGGPGWIDRLPEYG